MGNRRESEAAARPPRHISRGAVFLAVAIILASTAVAVAIVVSDPGSSTGGDGGDRGAAQGAAPVASAASAISAGRYVQAGSFKVLADAETEHERLASLGIGAQLLSSNLTQELYPGFEVLAVGPITGRGGERATIRRLRSGGVPTAFARELSPASTSAYGDVSGTWRGTLEEISSAHPTLNRSMEVTVSFDSSGDEGQLEVPSLGCRVTLDAGGSDGAILSFDQHPACLGSGPWRLRPSAGALMMSLLPPGNDLIFLGTLNAA